MNPSCSEGYSSVKESPAVLKRCRGKVYLLVYNLPFRLSCTINKCIVHSIKPCHLHPLHVEHTSSRETGNEVSRGSRSNCGRNRLWYFHRCNRRPEILTDIPHTGFFNLLGGRPVIALAHLGKVEGVLAIVVMCRLTGYSDQTRPTPGNVAFGVCSDIVL